jgi:trans-aconitate methyltransferase
MSFPSGRYKAADAAYTLDAGFGEPKEYFKRVVSLIARDHASPMTLVDAGCATGAFIHYAKQKLTLQAVAGIDVSDAYVREAAAKQPDVEFLAGSIADPSALGGRTFDVCTCLGTVSIFDDLAEPLRALLGFVRARGSLYVLDVVNDDPVDIVMRYRVASEPVAEWRPAFNVRSLLTYKRLVAALAPGAILSAEDFEMPFAIPRSADPMRAWTMVTAARPHQVVVGTGQLLNFKILTIRKP